jgi:hypothetical protein
VEILYFTLVAAGLYFFSDWLLARMEAVRGKRFEQRSLIFFAIILVLTLLTFQLINALQPAPTPTAAGQPSNNIRAPEQPAVPSP